MKGILFLAGLFVAAYTYFFVTTFLVLRSDIPERIQDYWLSPIQMKVFLFAAIPIIIGHLFLSRTALKKHKLDISVVIPFAVTPYMLGIIVQAMIL